MRGHTQLCTLELRQLLMRGQKTLDSLYVLLTLEAREVVEIVGSLDQEPITPTISTDSSLYTTLPSIFCTDRSAARPHVPTLRLQFLVPAAHFPQA